MIKNYSIRDLIALLLSKIWLILILTVVFGCSSFIVSKFFVSPRYESFTTMYVKNNAVNSEKEANVDINDLNASKSLASTYITVLKSNAVMNQVAARLTELYDIDDLKLIFKVKKDKIDVASIRDSFSMTAVDQTEVIKVTANTLNPNVSTDMCNIIAEIAPDFLIRVVGAGSVEIIDTAIPDTVPVSPNVSVTSLIGALIGFIIGVYLILLIDFFDDTIKETEELTERYNKAILGEIQTIETGKKNKKKSRGSHSRSATLLTDESIPFDVVESYKTIRSNIMFTLGTTDKKVIAVSSANPGEGKSTTTANVAIALAQTGSSVLLIDADMRKPVQHKIFKASNIDGLSTLIIMRSTKEKAVKSNVIQGLDLLSSGPIPPNPSELLASDRFKTLIDEFAETYDYVIIDTPPVNVVSDAMVMNESISGIVIVLKYSSTTYGALSGSMKQIDLVKSNVLGFVMNEVDYSHRSRYSYYKYYGKEGYSYGRRPETETTQESFD